MSEPFMWDERSTREAVKERSNGYCEWGTGERRRGAWSCRIRATNVHHRKNLSQGGKWHPANCMHLCGSGTTGCHGYYTEHPTEAHDVGVTVKRGENPADTPVRTPRGELWLTDDVTPPRRRRVPLQEERE